MQRAFERIKGFWFDSILIHLTEVRADTVAKKECEKENGRGKGKGDNERVPTYL